MESFELPFSLEFPSLSSKFKWSQQMTACMIQRVSAIGSHPTAASTQELLFMSKEVYTYTSLLMNRSSVRGAKEVELAEPPGRWAGGAPKAQGWEWYLKYEC